MLNDFVLFRASWILIDTFIVLKIIGTCGLKKDAFAFDGGGVHFHG